MKYGHIWAKALNPGEDIKYEFSVGEKYSLVSTIVLTVVLFPFFFIVLPAALFYYYFYLPRANAYAFTNKRVLIHKGWLSTGAISVDYDKITDVIVKEPFWERILSKTGHLAINTAGSAGHEIVLQHINLSYEIKKKLYQIKGV